MSCQSESPKHPNIIYILADDLGYGDLSPYQEIIETPNLHALRASGIRFTQHYTGAPVCAPARCILLTGQHSGNAYVRGNDEWNARGDVWDYEAMFKDSSLEGQRPLPDSITTIAEILQSAGYRTGMVGKWGLGAPGTEGVPNEQGFDYFYGYNCQRQAHTYYPMHLWENDQRVLLNNKMVAPHSNLADGADPNNTSSYNDFNLNDYAPDLMHKKALEFIQKDTDNPFFLYYASPIPHLPLQAPKHWVDYYRKKIGDEEPYTGKSYFPCQYPRATYAAMISLLDEQVGELVEVLKKQGELENTLIIFTSDNGPTYDIGGADSKYFNSGGPFLSHRGRGKGFTHEGGIRIPMIASWPNQIPKNMTNDHPSAFYDLLATVCDLIQVDIPVETDGISFLPALLGQENEQHEYLYWEFPEYNGQQALRMGEWKGIWKNLQTDSARFELYNLNNDLSEESDLSKTNVQMADEIKDKIANISRTTPIDKFKIAAIDE